MFQEYSSNGRVLSTVDLRDFLKDQGEDNTLIHAQSLILSYELNEWGKTSTPTFMPQFFHFLMQEFIDYFAVLWKSHYIVGSCSL